MVSNSSQSNNLVLFSLQKYSVHGIRENDRCLVVSFDFEDEHQKNCMLDNCKLKSYMTVIVLTKTIEQLNRLSKGQQNFVSLIFTLLVVSDVLKTVYNCSKSLGFV